MIQRDRVIDCYNKSAHSYAKTLFHELAGKRLDRILLQDFSKTHLNDLILDIGCGCGQTSRYLFDQGCRNVVGMDLSSAMIEESSMRNSDTSFRFVQGDMLNMSFEDDSFDDAIAFYAIVHFTHDELELAFREIHRVLKRGGEFLFSFHIGSEHNYMTEFFGAEVDVTFYFFEVDDVLERLRRGGWNVIEVIERLPYVDKEYPSKRAYISCIK